MYEQSTRGFIMMHYDDLPSKIRLELHESMAYGEIYSRGRIEWSADDLDKFKRFWCADIVKSLIHGSISRQTAEELTTKVLALP